ncbi:MAG: hypothetical protein IPG29_05390 [Sphingobacteriales bacterium]|nr:hypothetical protein [Sphingobacteriales bacterium]
MELRNTIFFIFILVLLLPWHCKQPSADKTEGTQPQNLTTDSDVLNSIIANADSLRTFDFVNERVAEIKKALQQKTPVLLCKDTLSEAQKMAELIALSDENVLRYTRQPETNLPYRNEVFGVYPARESDFSDRKSPGPLTNFFRFEMYNFGLNLATIAIVDLAQKKVLTCNHTQQAQPDIPANLKELATKIAVHSPEVQQALGYKPDEAQALMASTKTALNRTRCERSKSLCVAPTFVKGDKALWAIVDLTRHSLVGIRWTNVGTTGPALRITERRLQDDKITACFCEKSTALNRNNWKLNYMITSSDGLQVSEAFYNNQPIVTSAKLVDWHVSYSGTDGFGYSDAVGCPYFSQAAVLAIDEQKINDLKNKSGESVGFTLEQTFRSEGWPTPCSYNYKQRFEFYDDGRFRMTSASLGRGCGDNATYRPVFRIAMANPQMNFAEWDGKTWKNWEKEGWQLQKPTTKYAKNGYQYALQSAQPNQSGYYITPGNRQFDDGGRGDNAYLYVSLYKPDANEGESDFITIGPCCNEDYKQGPEQFIEPNPETITNAKLGVWYVPQIKNDDTKGREYCWAESFLEDGVIVTKTYPCFSGPLFTPYKM